MIRLVSGLLLVIAVFCGPMAQAADSHAAKGVVERLQSDVIAILKQAKELGVDGRYQRLLPVLTRDVHMTLMTATATGSFWRK